ncbi:glycosyltransferase family 2 protein [Macellibacteroides fermentans]|uniref:glycosyltransferase family 2 protein n=1 Tax=Macellibacteroides fermentans TaxID=879969 RepID=UPI00406C26C7
MNPLVSINLCCYNSEKYLRKTLESIVNQTYKVWELIVINDGSIDSTESIVREYIDKGYPITYHYQQNRGLSYSRNKALDLSHGEYIALIDHDDLWLPTKLEKQIKIMQNTNYALCYGGIIRIDKTGMEIGKRIIKNKRGFILEKLLKDFDIEVPTVLIRKSVLDNFKLRFDEQITASEEYCLFMQMAVLHEFCASSEVYAKYRVHDEALTNKAIDKWAKEREYTLDLICKKHPGIKDKYSCSFGEAYARARYYRARFYVNTGETHKAISELRKIIFVDYRYFILFVMLFLPKTVWHYMHKLHSGRS